MAVNYAAFVTDPGTASAANVDFVCRLGADEVIDYGTERFEDVVRDVDVVFDTVGGETLERSWACSSPVEAWSPSPLPENGRPTRASVPRTS
jgi:hypothetical protein